VAKLGNNMAESSAMTNNDFLGFIDVVGCLLTGLVLFGLALIAGGIDIKFNFATITLMTLAGTWVFVRSLKLRK
jgi:hypothetical protein